MHKIILSLITALGLLTNAQAQLGHTLAECKDHYGAPTKVERNSAAPGRTKYIFNGDSGYQLGIFIMDGKVSRVVLVKPNEAEFTADEAAEFFKQQAPDATWGDPYNVDSGDVVVEGSIDGEVAVYGEILDESKVAAIWTVEDDQAVAKADKENKHLVKPQKNGSTKNTDETN